MKRRTLNVLSSTLKFNLISGEFYEKHLSIIKLKIFKFMTEKHLENFTNFPLFNEVKTKESETIHHLT